MVKIFKKKATNFFKKEHVKIAEQLGYPRYVPNYKQEIEKCKYECEVVRCLTTWRRLEKSKTTMFLSYARS